MLQQQRLDYCQMETPCHKIEKPLVVYRFSGNVITSIITLGTIRENLDVLH